MNFPRSEILPPYPPTGNPPCSSGQQPGRNRHTRPGGRGPQSRRPVGWITTPPGKRAKMQKIQRARDGGKTAPVLRFCRQYRGRGNLIPAQGNRGGGNAASGGTGTPPAGLDFPDFSEPLKREFSQLLQYIKNGEFPEFLDTVKRGFSSGDCATNGDTFSEREKLNFLQRKKGVKSELKDPYKKGRNGSCCLCGNGAFCGRLFPWRCWRLSRGIGGRTGQKGSQYGNGWRRWRFLTVEAAGERPGGGGAKSLRGTRRKTTPPIFRARCQNCENRGILAALCCSRRGWPG